MKLTKKIAIAIMSLTCISLMACNSGDSTADTKVKGNEEFLKVASKAINKRWDEQAKKDVSGYAEGEYVKILEIENKSIEEATVHIEDDALLQAAKDYVEGNNLMIQSNLTTDEDLVYEYVEKSETLRKPALINMVDNFGLVINDNNKQIYEDFKVKATVINKDNDAKKFADKLATEIKFEVTKEYDWSTCETVVENTSEIDFESIYFNVQFKDADGIVVDTGILALDNFTKGSKQKADVSTDKVYETVEVSVDTFYLK